MPGVQEGKKNEKERKKKGTFTGKKVKEEHLGCSVKCLPTFTATTCEFPVKLPQPSKSKYSHPKRQMLCQYNSRTRLEETNEQKLSRDLCPSLGLWSYNLGSGRDQDGEQG